MTLEKQASQSIAEHTPVTVLQTLASLAYDDINEPKVLFISGVEHSGKHALSQFVNINLNKADALTLNPWHLPNSNNELTTLNRHIEEWAPHAKIIQFTNIANKPVIVDNIAEIARMRNAHVIVYVNSLNAVNYVDETFMSTVLVANMNDNIASDQIEMGLEARLVSEQKRALVTLKNYYEPNNSLMPELFEQAKIRIVKYREPVAKTKKKH